MAEMAFARVGSSDLVVIVHTQKDPPAAEWDRLFVLLNDVMARTNSLRALVLTDGGGPDGNARKRFDVLGSGKSYSTAVVTDSVVVRTIVNTMNMFNKGIHAFSSANVVRAMDHLKISGQERTDALAIASSLTAHVGPREVLRRALQAIG